MKQAKRDEVKKARWREICTAHYCLSKKGGRNKHESTHTFSYKSKKSARINHIFFFNCYIWRERKQGGVGTGEKANSPEYTLRYR